MLEWASAIRPRLCRLVRIARCWRVGVVLAVALGWTPVHGEGPIRHIVVPPGASAELRTAVGDLAEVIALAEGVEPKILASAWRFPQNAIYVGDSRITRSALRLARDLGRDATVYRRGEGNRIFVRAKTGEGLIHGVYTLAHEEFGGRWFLVHEPDAFVVDPGEGMAFQGRGWVRREPFFVQRATWPTQTHASGAAFFLRNRLNRRYSFNHALARIFNEALFAERPELFSERRGVVQPPRESAKLDSQPHLASEAVAEVAAQAALAYFEKNPEATSFSLSTNDNVLFDETEATRAIVEPLRWFRGMPVYTDLVFGFMNRVAERVFEEGGAWSNALGEPRYLTSLAYYWAEAPPSFPIHPRVMPILTADRSQWHDPAFAEEDRGVVSAWMESGAETVGTWTYLYGGPYPYPRQFTREWVESIRFLADAGVRVFFGEMPHIFGFDGPKAYLVAQMLWDPYADAERLLEEYYSGVFGEAADLLRRYFEAFEKKRRGREGPAAWIQHYLDEAGIELFPLPFLEAKGRVLAEAALLVREDAQASQRIREVQRDYAIMWTYAQMHDTRRQLLRAIAKSETSELAKNILRFDTERETLGALLETVHQRYLRSLILLRPTSQSDPIPAALGLLMGGAELSTGQAKPLPTALQTLAAQYAVSAEEGDLRLVSPNPSLVHQRVSDERHFLFPNEAVRPVGWGMDARAAEFFTVTAAEGRAGRGVRFSGADAASLFADVVVKPGADYLLEADLGFRVSPDNRSALAIIWRDAKGASVGVLRLFQAPVCWPDDEAECPAEIRLHLPLQAPDNAVAARIRLATARQRGDDYFEIRTVRLSERTSGQ